MNRVISLLTRLQRREIRGDDNDLLRCGRALSGRRHPESETRRSGHSRSVDLVGACDRERSEGRQRDLERAPTNNECVHCGPRPAKNDSDSEPPYPVVCDTPVSNVPYWPCTASRKCRVSTPSVAPPSSRQHRPTRGEGKPGVPPPVDADHQPGAIPAAEHAAERALEVVAIGAADRRAARIGERGSMANGERDAPHSICRRRNRVS